MNFRDSLLIALLAALPLSPARAEPLDIGRYTEASACWVWAPTRLATDEYALRYNGACQEDERGRRRGQALADGEGRAEWYLRGQGENAKAAIVWEGKFKNGVFVGQADLARIDSIDPVFDDRYLIAQGRIADTRLWFESRGAEDGPLDPCAVDLLRLSTRNPSIAGDDARAKELLHEAIRVYRRACPDVQASIRAVLHVLHPPFTYKPAVELEASSVTGEESGYRNRVTEALEENERQNVKTDP